jgi:sensor histidine kinase regulating citrate/malate metabolism
MFSLEPEEIARLLEERVAIFQAMCEGIVAIDTNSQITVANKEVQKLLGKTDKEIIGRKIFEMVPNSKLPEVSRQCSLCAGLSFRFQCLQKFLLCADVLFGNQFFN